LIEFEKTEPVVVEKSEKPDSTTVAAEPETENKESQGEDKVYESK